MKLFDWANDFLDKFELSWVTLITKGLPLLVTLPVANQTRIHARIHLEYTPTWSWILAVIVELFGYASIYKALQFAEHNRKYTDEKRKAPYRTAIMVWVFYLALVITFNVIPELATNKETYKIAMNVAISLLNVPGGVLAGISAIHTERKAEIARTYSRTNSRTPNTPNTPNEQDEQRTPRTPNTRTPNTIPQPAARTNNPFTIPADTERRVQEAQDALTQANNGNPPSVRQVQAYLREQDGRTTGWSTDTVSKHMRK